MGPIYGASGGADAELLAACYRNALSLAVEHGLRTVAVSSISTGAFGYPREAAAAVASKAIADFLATDTILSEVRLVFYSRDDARMFESHQLFVER